MVDYFTPFSLIRTSTSPGFTVRVTNSLNEIPSVVLNPGIQIYKRGATENIKDFCGQYSNNRKKNGTSGYRSGDGRETLHKIYTAGQSGKNGLDDYQADSEKPLLIIRASCCRVSFSIIYTGVNP